MKKLYGAIVFLSMCVAAFAGEYTEFELGEKIKILKNKKFSPLRVYIFIDVSSCSVCNENIEFVQEAIDDISIDSKIFVNNADYEFAKEITANYKLLGDVVADEYSVYKELYKIKQSPSMLITDNEGKLLYEEKLGAKIDLKRIKELYRTNNNKTQKKSNKHLVLQKEIFIQKDSKNITCPEFNDAIYDPSASKYIFTLNRTCSMLFADNNGIVDKVIDLLDYKNFNSSCFVGLYNLSWSVPDSIINIYLPNNYNKAEIQQFNIHQDSLYPGYELLIDSVGRRNRQDYIGSTLNSNHFLMAHNVNRSLNYKLNEDDKVVYMYNRYGEPVNYIGTPDSIYLNYTMSGFYKPSITVKNDTSFYVYEPATDNIKLYSESGELLKIVKIKLSDEYRVIKENLTTEISGKDYYSSANHRSINNQLFFDKTTGNIILFYENRTYPADCEDSFDSRITYDFFITVFDKNGKSIFDTDIKLPNDFPKPCYIDNNVLHVTDIIDKKLHVSIYKLKY